MAAMLALEMKSKERLKGLKEFHSLNALIMCIILRDSSIIDRVSLKCVTNEIMYCSQLLNAK